MDFGILEALLFDDQRIVTAVTLSRHASLPIDESVDIMKTFFETNKGKAGLWAVYAVSGCLKKNDVPTDAIILCKDSDLESKTANFINVRSTDIYSLQVIEVEDMYSIIASDLLEDERFFHEDAGRASIKTDKIVQFRLEMEKHHDEKAKSTAQVNTTKTSANTTRMKKSVEEKKPIMKMFQKLDTKDKIVQSSPSNSLGDNHCPNKTTLSENLDCDEACINSETNTKRRTKRILIDDEASSFSPNKYKGTSEDSQNGKIANKNKENDSKTNINKRKTENDTEININKQKKEMNHEIAQKRKHAKKTLDDGDLFDAAGSPEKEINSSEGSTVCDRNTPNSPSKHRISPPKTKQITKNIENSAPPAKRKVLKRVTETFKDEDGFLVTKEVLREVSVEPNDDSNVVLRPTSSNSQTVTSVQKGKKLTVSGSQSKISSFFSKK